MTTPIALHPATPAELDDWDLHAVDAPGGHVLQSRALGEHWARHGWTPRYLAAEGGVRVLALVRPWPAIGGGSAYVPRGPAPIDGTDTAARVVAVAMALGRDGCDVVAVDPEVPVEDGAYRSRLASAGFHPIEELQASRHRLSLPLPDDRDEAVVFAGIARSTRQRIRGAERDGITVVRHDVRAAATPVEGVATPAEPLDPALGRFRTMLGATADRRGFRFARTEAVAWWRTAIEAGHAILLEAAAPDGERVAGLLLYRHGGRLSTVHSADRADLRRAHPGALHLLRWSAVRMALAAGCRELDLGGVDVAGARRPPVEGESTYGLYQHKVAFGGRWVELAGAHERVIRPWRYAAGRVTARLLRTVGR
jgi:hypothetical protein